MVVSPTPRRRRGCVVANYHVGGIRQRLDDKSIFGDLKGHH